MIKVRNLLQIRIARFPGGVSAVAKALGCSRTFLYMLMSGEKDKRPCLDLAWAIEKLLGVPMRLWVKPISDRKRAA